MILNIFVDCETKLFLIDSKHCSYNKLWHVLSYKSQKIRWCEFLQILFFIRLLENILKQENHFLLIFSVIKNIPYGDKHSVFYKLDDFFKLL